MPRISEVYYTRQTGHSARSSSSLGAEVAFYDALYVSALSQFYWLSNLERVR